MFRQEHIGTPKVDAVAGMLAEINLEIGNNLKVIGDGYKSQNLSGYVFLCVDNIELRREIALSNRNNPHIKVMFDFRTRLTDAQHYAADWSNITAVGDFIQSTNFTHDEAVTETPVSACNVTLSVAPTIRMICALGVANFVNYVKSGELKKFIQMDAFGFTLDAF
jgi:molybdopterin/thiamine biosynthesis adenylyltransferase